MTALKLSVVDLEVRGFAEAFASRCANHGNDLPGTDGTACHDGTWYSSHMSTSLLDQIIEPFTECLTADAARKIVALRADTDMQTRVDELANKANAGTLDDQERTEYDRYLAAFHFVTIMQCRARRLLNT